MAMIYKTPAELGKRPEWNFDATPEENIAAENAWVDKVAAFLKERGTGPYAGKEVRFPVADGHARYLIASLKPVILVHLPLGDAWEFRYANRLTAKDLKANADVIEAAANQARTEETEAAAVKPGTLMFYREFHDTGYNVKVLRHKKGTPCVECEFLNAVGIDDVSKHNAPGTIHTIHAGNLHASAGARKAYK